MHLKLLSQILYLSGFFLDEACSQLHNVKKTFSYTVLHFFAQVLFWAGNQGSHQYFNPIWTDEAKKNYISYIHTQFQGPICEIFAKNIENWQIWKTQFFESAISIFFLPIFFCFIPKNIVCCIFVHPHENQSKCLE